MTDPTITITLAEWRALLRRRIAVAVAMASLWVARRALRVCGAAQRRAGLELSVGYSVTVEGEGDR